MNRERWRRGLLALLPVAKWITVVALCVAALAWVWFLTSLPIAAGWMRLILPAAFSVLPVAGVLWMASWIGSKGRFVRWMVGVVVATLLLAGLAVVPLAIQSLAPPSAQLSNASLKLLWSAVGSGVAAIVSMLVTARILLRPQPTWRGRMAQWIAFAALAPAAIAACVLPLGTELGFLRSGVAVDLIMLGVPWMFVVSLLGAITLGILGKKYRETYDTTAQALALPPADLVGRAHFQTPCPGCAVPSVWVAGEPRVCPTCAQLVGFEIDHYQCRCGYALRGRVDGCCPECGAAVVTQATPWRCPWCDEQGRERDHAALCAGCGLLVRARLLVDAPVTRPSIRQRSG